MALGTRGSVALSLIVSVSILASSFALAAHFRKPGTSPRCGNGRIAAVRYGFQIITPKLEKELDEGQVVLGGCVISDRNPAWQCVDCGEKLFR